MCVEMYRFGLMSTIFHIDFKTVLTVWYVLLDFGTVLTVWYFFIFIFITGRSGSQFSKLIYNKHSCKFVFTSMVIP
jgi:hypothetical protein